MKILFPFIGDTIGGSHISAVDYIIELEKKKITTKVLLFKKNAYLEKYLLLKKIKFDVVNLPIINLNKNILINFFFIFFGIIKARKYLIKNKIDIVHTNDIRNHYSWSIWSLYLSKHIWHQRTMWPRSLQFYFFILMAKKVFCNSKYLVDKIKFKFIKKKSYLVTNIIHSQKKVVFKKNSFLIIGFFSNIQNIKRPDIIINFLKKITLQKLNIKIHCFGTDKKNIFKEYSKKIIFKNHFQYFGHKINILPYMKKCDYIVATSDNDTLGRTILEGMSLGIPTFANNSGGHRYLIKDSSNGYLFNSNGHGLFKKIMKVRKNEALNRKVICNALKYINNYSKDKILHQLIKSYGS